MSIPRAWISIGWTLVSSAAMAGPCEGYLEQYLAQLNHRTAAYAGHSGFVESLLEVGQYFEVPLTGEGLSLRAGIELSNRVGVVAARANRKAAPEWFFGMIQTLPVSPVFGPNVPRQLKILTSDGPMQFDWANLVSIYLRPKESELILRKEFREAHAHFQKGPLDLMPVISRMQSVQKNEGTQRTYFKIFESWVGLPVDLLVRNNETGAVARIRGILAYFPNPDPDGRVELADSSRILVRTNPFEYRWIDSPLAQLNRESILQFVVRTDLEKSDPFQGIEPTVFEVLKRAAYARQARDLRVNP